MTDENNIEDFYGVYLLYCTNPKYKGRTYIGYTVDPNRRIKQHNKGKQYGGAWRTSNRGPWEMVLIIHGFPNDVSALRFEWAWQHPDVSRRLRHVPKKKSSERVYDYYLRVLSQMLQTGPWNRLSLSIRWLKQEYCRELMPIPPMHMPVLYGPVMSTKKVKPQEPEDDDTLLLCSICRDAVITADSLTCLVPECPLIVHVICLGKMFRTSGNLIPIEGKCPACGTNLLWGDLVRKKRGCYSDLSAFSNPLVNKEFKLLMNPL